MRSPRRSWLLAAWLSGAACASAPPAHDPDPGTDAGGSATGGSGPDAARVTPTGGAMGTGGSTTLPDAAAAASPDGAGVTPPATNLVKIFDGTSFENWEYNPGAWTLKDGAMVGKVSGGQSMAFTKKDYSSFRLIVWSRMVVGNDHLGICLWGGRPAAGKYGFEKCLLVIPPNGAIWDYLTNTDNPKPDYQKGMTEWHKTEILANRATGRVQVAVNGKLVHDYQDPAAKLPKRQDGPIGVQIHKAGTESEYKDIEIEVDPKVDHLLTTPGP
jgi:hypothetical protein